MSEYKKKRIASLHGDLAMADSQIEEHRKDIKQLEAFKAEVRDALSKVRISRTSEENGPPKRL